MPRKHSSSKSVASITYWRRFAEHRLIYFVLAIVFGFGLVAYFGTGPMSGMGGRGGDSRSQQVIASVDGEDILRTSYDRQWDQYKRMVGGGNETQQISMQGMLLGSLIDSATMRAAAKKRGLTVSDAMIDKAVADMKKDRSGKPVPDADFEQMLQRQGLSIDELRTQLRTDLLPQVLQESIANSQRVSEQDLLNTYDEAKLRHILVSNTRLPDEQAKSKAQKIYEEVKSGKNFSSLANANSDDPSNKPMKWDPKLKREVLNGPAKGGALDWSPLSKYVPEFADAVRKLKPGEVSPPVKTQFGYHVIELEAPIKQNLPKDFQKDKTKLLADLRKKKGQEAFSKLMEEQKKTAKVVWRDPGLEWRYDYSKSNPMFAMPGQPRGDQAALAAKLEKYVADHPEDGVAAIVLGQMIYPQYLVAQAGPAKEKLRAQVIKDYETGLAHSEDAEVRMTLGALYQDAKQKDKALKVYQTEQRLLRWDDSAASKSMHVRLARAFKDLGDLKAAAEEDKRIADLTAQEKKAAEEARVKAAQAKADQAKKSAAARKTTLPGGTITVGTSGKMTVTPDSAGKPASANKTAESNAGQASRQADTTAARRGAGQ